MTHITASFNEEEEVDQHGRSTPDDQIPDYWPKPQTTDADGRFTMGGVPKGSFASLILTHPDCAVEDITVTTGPKTMPVLEAFEIVPVEPDFTFTLKPARPVEGTVTAADTGKPMAGVLVEMIPMRRHGGQQFYTHTDAKGHYHVSGHQAETYYTTVFPPPGSGYVAVSHHHQGWPAGAKVLTMDIALPRGRLVSGRVIDADTKQPVVNAGVIYQPQRNNKNNRDGYEFRSPTLTDADGRFTVTALPGSGFVVVEGPDPNYLRVSFEGGLRERAFPHGVAPIVVPEQGEPAPVEVALRKGVTLEVRAVAPDGQPVERVLGYCQGIDAQLIDRWDQGRLFADGVFRFPGADPSKTYRVYLIQTKRHLGAVADFQPDPARQKPFEVTLQATASVHGRVVTPDGKPLTTGQVYPLLVVAPGKGELKRDELLGRPDQALFYSNITQEYFANEKPDAEGRFRFENLLPGARFTIVAAGSDTGEAFHPVAALKPGEDRDLGTITMKKTKGGG